MISIYMDIVSTIFHGLMKYVVLPQHCPLCFICNVYISSNDQINDDVNDDTMLTYTPDDLRHIVERLGFDIATSDTSYYCCDIVCKDLTLTHQRKQTQREDTQNQRKIPKIANVFDCHRGMVLLGSPHSTHNKIQQSHSNVKSLFLQTCYSSFCQYFTFNKICLTYLTMSKTIL